MPHSLSMYRITWPQIALLVTLHPMWGLWGCAGSTEQTNTNKNGNKSSAEICDNGIDDDGDGLTDTEDSECSQDCHDTDQDGYQDIACGGTDCRDDDPKVSPGAAEKCNDGTDNNCDGLTDDEDESSCPSNCQDADNDGYADQSCGGTDCRDDDRLTNPGATEKCNDGIDNDCDQSTDCDDSDCAQSAECLEQEENCGNGLDDDGDGLTDCEDTDCTQQVCGTNGLVCQGGNCICPGGTAESVCNDGIDDDCDGSTDCSDDDCAQSPECSGQEGSCSDGVDGDNDGLTDCEDPDCAQQSCGQNGVICQNGHCSCPGGTIERNCTDGIDNDCDGLTDASDSSDCSCTDGTSQTCGVSDVGECRFGVQQCVGNMWGPCQGAVDPRFEVCNGLDEDCDGVCDNGTFLPPLFDAMEWLPNGFWGLGDSALVVWDDYFAYYETTTGQVTEVGPLVNLWNAAGTSGTQPPIRDIDSLAAVPAGYLGYTSDFLFVTAGPTYYYIERATGQWTSGPIENILGPTVNFDHLDAVTFIPPGGLAAWPTESWMIADHDIVWVYDAPNTTWVGPFSVDEAFCPTGTVGTCPPCVDSLMLTPGTPGTLFVGCQGTVYTSPFDFDHYNWSTTSMSVVPCTHDCH